MLRTCFLFLLVFGSSLGDHAITFPDDAQTNDTIQSRLGWTLLGKYPTIEAIFDGSLGEQIQTATTPPPTPPPPPPLPEFPPLPAMPSPLPSLPPIVTGISGLGGPLPSTAASETMTVLVEAPRCECLPAGLCVNHTTRNEATTRIVTRPPSGTLCAPGEVYCCVEFVRLGCGIPSIVPGVSPNEDQADLGEVPWSAIILTVDDVYVGGGILIDPTHVLTAAHKVARYGSGAGLKVRLGDWDLSNEEEPVSYLEVRISKIVNHPKFEATTLKNDISLITLLTPVTSLTRPYPQINTICLPESTAVFTGSRCKVAGWGKDQFNGQYQNIIKKVEVPVLSSIDCQSKLRYTRLGSSFVLDTNSFICAGGEPNKDACTVGGTGFGGHYANHDNFDGDGGTALACLRNGRYYLAGITAGGIECGIQNVPGLYVNMVNYLTWVYAQINGSGGTSGGIDPRRKP